MFNITFFYDLHIHSILSPDGDILMTPNNILNMAMLKKLDFIAITDHNSTLQLNIIEQICDSYDFIVIPGIEVTVKEGFDVLCYFPSFQDSYNFNQFIELHLTEDFGPWTHENQVITDIYDNPCETVKQSLTHTIVPYSTLVQEVKKHNGIIILAHIERKNKSALNVYTLDKLEFDGIEIQKYKKDEFIMTHPETKNYKILTSSDAHSLLEIAECENTLELPEKTIDAFINYFKENN